MLIALIGCAVLFAGAGIAHALWNDDARSFEDYVTARGQIGRLSTTLTLFASSMGAWVLFGPPEAATWGGVPAVVGYSIGSVLPLLVYIPLGRRLRTLMPDGHTLTEYVRLRYGRMMHAFTGIVMIFYLFIALTAQVTGMGLIMQLVADVPLWITAGVVLLTTVGYTALGGLRASIFTDGFQSVLLLPLLVGVMVAAFIAVGGTSPLARLGQEAPALLQWTYRPGLEGAAALIIGIAAASVFNQGTWQRVYAAESVQGLRVSFTAAAAAIAPVVAVTGLLGLAAVGVDRAEPASTALFNVLLDAAPGGVGIGLVVLGLTLVMSSADTALNAIASLIAVDMRPLLPSAGARALLRVARWATALLAVPVFGIAAQGYSVLYLFLIADLVCAAAVVPVFGGLFDTRITGRAAVLGTLSGLLVGGWLFPPPGSTASLLPAFATALFVPAAVTFALRARTPVFEMEALRREVRTIE